MIAALALALAATTFVATATEPKCENGLTAPMTLPYVIAPIDARAVAERLETSIADAGGTLQTFTLVENAVAPVMQNIASFLQTRKNYPMLFERNEISEQASLVHDELVKLLGLLKAAREHPAPAPESPPDRSWFTTLFGGDKKTSPERQSLVSPDVEGTALRVRWLHFTLISLAEEMKALTPAVESLATQTGALLRDGEAMSLALALLGTHLQTADVRVELKLRLEALAEDLRLQLQLVRNLTAVLDQRVQFDGLYRDQIRRVLSVLLPMEAVMGTTPLDLSPLEPPDPGSLARQISGLTESAGSRPKTSVEKTRLSVEAFLATAQSIAVTDNRNKAISIYLQTYKSELMPNEVNDLLNKLNLGFNSPLKDNLLLEYVEARHDDLSVDQVCFLAKLTGTYDGQNSIVEWFSRAEFERLSTPELTQLGQHLLGDAQKIKHYELMGIGGTPVQGR